MDEEFEGKHDGSGAIDPPKPWKSMTGSCSPAHLHHRALDEAVPDLFPAPAYCSARDALL